MCFINTILSGLQSAIKLIHLIIINDLQDPYMRYSQVAGTTLCLQTWCNDAGHARISREILPVPLKLENIIIS